MKRPGIEAEFDSSTSLIVALESGSGVALVQEGFESLAGSRLGLRPLERKTGADFSLGGGLPRAGRLEANPGLCRGLSWRVGAAASVGKAAGPAREGQGVFCCRAS